MDEQYEEGEVAEVEAAEGSECAEEEAGEEIITPAYQTEEHHLDAHALRRQAVLTGRPGSVAWSAGPNPTWVFDRPEPVRPEYDAIEYDAPYNFIADPQQALDAMAEYHRFQGNMHKQIGLAC